MKGKTPSLFQKHVQGPFGNILGHATTSLPLHNYLI